MREWVEQALCRQIGGDFWYADDQKSFEEQNIAKRVCQMCPVQVQCACSTPWPRMRSTASGVV